MKKIIEAQIPEEKLNRLATVFIQAANEFSSYIVISRGGNSVNAKSLLGFLSLGMSSGTPIEISAEGADAEKALETLSHVLMEHA